MSDIFDRIEKVRSDSTLSLRAFGDRLGVSYGAVANIKYKNVEKPSDILIKAICSEFNVNRYWLETGEGDPYQYKETKQDLIDQIRVVMKGESEVAVAIVCAVASLPTEYLEAFYDRLQEQLRNKKEED